MMTRNSKIKILAACLVALFIISLFPRPASTQSSFLVNTTSDTVDNNIGDGFCVDADGNCSLRAAIQESNALPGFPPEEIILPAGVYVLTMNQLTIQNSLNLMGDGPESTIIDGNGMSSIFQIDGTNSPIVNISGVTIRNGQGGIGFGTGIFNSAGSSLLLANSVVRDNRSAVGGVGISNSGILTIFRSTVRDNQITGGGGGVTGVGGGILNTRMSGQTTTPVLNIIESTISDNQGIRGGGIANSARLDIINSTISGNRASVGGGIRNFSAGVVNISFSTITDNEAGLVSGEPRQNWVGGGIANLGQVNMGNTILAGNNDGRTPSDPLFSPDCHSMVAFGFTSFRGNLVGILNENCDFRDTIWGDTRFDLVGTEEAPLDAKLYPLADNGGPTKTHALQPDSPAIDNGTGVTSATFFDCPGTDQRGVPRPQGAACDIGSYELETVIPPANLSITKSDAPDPVTAGSNLTYTLSVTNNGPGDATGVMVTDALPAGVTFVSATPSQGSCTLVTCDLGNLVNGANATITIIVTVNPAVPGGTITNTASVTANEVDPNTADNTASEDTTVRLLVPIDIKPRDRKNTINPGSRGKVPVAILSTPGFDAPNEVDRTSLTFGRTGNEASLASCDRRARDINHDGLLDLICNFFIRLTGFQVGDTEGILRGETVNGILFEGHDSVRIVPPRPRP